MESCPERPMWLSKKITNVILDRQGEIIGLIVKKKKKSCKAKQNTHV